MSALCGYNTGYHVYLEMGAVGTSPSTKAYIKFDLDSANWKSYNRRWNILASQIECDRDYHAPQVRLEWRKVNSNHEYYFQISQWKRESNCFSADYLFARAVFSISLVMVVREQWRPSITINQLKPTLVTSTETTQSASGGRRDNVP